VPVEQVSDQLLRAADDEAAESECLAVDRVDESERIAVQHAKRFVMSGVAEADQHVGRERQCRSVVDESRPIARHDEVGGYSMSAENEFRMVSSDEDESEVEVGTELGFFPGQVLVIGGSEVRVHVVKNLEPSSFLGIGLLGSAGSGYEYSAGFEVRVVGEAVGFAA